MRRSTDLVMRVAAVALLLVLTAAAQSASGSMAGFGGHGVHTPESGFVEQFVCEDHTPSSKAEDIDTLWTVADHVESDTPYIPAVAAPQTGLLILVRHADRYPNETDLNATGIARAAALPGVLADVPLDAILIPDLRRNADTAAPLAAERGLTPNILEPNASLADALADAADGQSMIWGLRRVPATVL